MTDHPPPTDEELAEMGRKLTEATDRDGELYLVTDAPDDMRRLLAEVDRLRAELDAKRVDPDAVHYARIGSAFTACGHALPNVVPWSAEQYDYGPPRLSSLRENTTCPRCRSRLGLDRFGGSS